MASFCQEVTLKSTGADTGLAVTSMPEVAVLDGEDVLASGVLSALGAGEGTNIWQPPTKKIKNSNNHFFICLSPSETRND
jgi:hypothetical protein